jgi:hypothetical protein
MTIQNFLYSSIPSGFRDSTLNQTTFTSFHFVSNQLLIMNEEYEFESRWCQESSLLHVVRVGSEIHTASYTMGEGEGFPQGKAAWE